VPSSNMTRMAPRSVEAETTSSRTDSAPCGLRIRSSTGGAPRKSERALPSIANS
jgi:hypothetical protein